MKNEPAKIPAKYLGPHYNGRIFKCYWTYVTNLYGPKVVKDICGELGVPLDILLADASWFSDTFLREFLRRLKEETGDPLVAWKAGKLLSSPEILNPIEYLVMSTSPAPLLFFRYLSREYEKFNRINKTRVENLKPGSFKFVATPIEGAFPSPDTCLSTLTMLPAAKEILGLDSFEVIHPECIHNGAKECVFVGKYSARKYWKRKTLRLLLYLITFSTGFFVLMLLTYKGNPEWTLLALEFACLILLTAIVHMGSRYFKMLNYIASYFHQTNENVRILTLERSRSEEAQKRSNLARRVSHDIRSPLAALEVAASLDSADEERQELIQSAIKRIRSIANDILTQKDQYAENPNCDVVVVARSIVREKRLEFLRSPKKIEIVEDLTCENSFAAVDGVELSRCISNILNNAIEAISDHGKITVRLRETEQAINLSIIDDGPGIPSALLSKITDEGFTFGKVGGSGLGLHQVKRFSAKFSCRLIIESRPNHTSIGLNLPQLKVASS